MNIIEPLTKEELGLLEYAINLAVGECAYDDIDSIQKLEDKIKNLCKKQKEFIKYLEDEIDWCIKQGDIFSIDMMGAFILSLDKYKEIIGVLDEKEM